MIILELITGNKYLSKYILSKVLELGFHLNWLMVSGFFFLVHGHVTKMAVIPIYIKNL